MWRCDAGFGKEHGALHPFDWCASVWRERQKGRNGCDTGITGETVNERLPTWVVSQKEQGCS